MSSESLQTLSTSNTNNDLKTFHVVVNLEDAEVYEFSGSVIFEVRAHDEKEAVSMCKLLNIKAVMQCVEKLDYIVKQSN